MPKHKKSKKPLLNLSDERLRVTGGLFFLSVAIVLTLAFVSFLFTWKSDQSFEWSLAFGNKNFVVENWSGKIGASLANLFMAKWLGLGAFCFPFIFFVSGLKLLNIDLLPLRKSIRISLVSAFVLSIGLGYLFEDTYGYMGSGLGGAHGHFISTWFIALIGRTGTAVLLILIYTSFLFFTFPSLLVKAKEIFSKSSEAGEDIEHQDEQATEGVDLTELSDQVNESENASSAPEIELSTEPVVNIAEEKINDEVFEVKSTVETKEEITIPKNAYDEKLIPAESDDDVDMTVEEKQEEETVSKVKVNNSDAYDPMKDLSNFKLPSVNLLEEYENKNFSVSEEELVSNKNRIIETLNNYKISIDKIKATIGPTITLYEIVPAPGVRISKIKNLEDDIALSLSALGIRIIAPMPGKGTIGIEVPNQHPETVSMKSIISSKKFQESKHALCIAMGKTISNETYVFDLAKTPHLLVAGATGQGKSVGLNAIIASLLYKKHPAQLKFVMVDPKKVELTLYSNIEKHYLAKLPGDGEAIITDTQQVITTLNSLCVEMDNRYDLLKNAQVRNIIEYNKKFEERRLNPEKGHRFLPYIVVIIDEFADLIMTAGREVETPIARLAQLARAIGIHLIIATQRPSTNIITGMIKANFPTRIAFRVTSMIDSRTILDSPGANQLIGRGDMLISSGSDMTRLQCAFIDIPELEKITAHIGDQRGYPEVFLLPEVAEEESAAVGEVDLNNRDALFEDAARLVVSHQQGSTSLIQRKFSIGYNRAGRIIDQLEAAGIVGPFEGSKARSVLYPDEFALEQYLNELN